MGHEGLYSQRNWEIFAAFLFMKTHGLTLTGLSLSLKNLMQEVLMHIPDGYLGPQTYLPLYGVSIGFWG